MPVLTKPSARAPQEPSRHHAVSSPWFIAAVLAAVLGLTGALLFGGATPARTLLDPGPVVRWGLPFALTVNNIAIALVIGCLVFAAGILPKEKNPLSRHAEQYRSNSGRQIEPRPEHPAFTRVLTVAGVASAAWTLAAITVLLLTYLDQAGIPLSGSPEFTQGLVYFMTDLASGRAWLAVSVFAAVVTTLCFGLRSRTGLAVTLALTLSALVPQALIGHSASSPDHEGAVSSLLLHIVGAALWLGGIVALCFVSSRILEPRRLTAQVLRRFSALALFAFCLVLASGTINAVIRLTSWEMLFGSAYGQLILLKTLATVTVGAIGFMHRRWIIPQLESGEHSARRVLWQLIGVELVILAATSGVAVGLSRSAPPQPTEYAPDTSPAEILSGYPLPPELTPVRWLTEWRMDWLWLAIAMSAAAAYLLTARRLRSSGGAWPRLKTGCWLLGIATLVYLTSGAPEVYGRVLLSVNITTQIALIAVAPVLLVLAAPVALAFRVQPAREDGSRGPREWLLTLTHSRLAAVLTHPVFASLNVIAGLAVFYSSPLLGFALRDYLGRELTTLYFLISGCLFTLSMIGPAGASRRFGSPLRWSLLAAVLAGYAAAGYLLTSTDALLQASYFGNLGRDWGVSAIADQQLGGALLWGAGAAAIVILVTAMAMRAFGPSRRAHQQEPGPKTGRNNSPVPDADQIKSSRTTNSEER
ncbi:bifunctional copper resistance protein CopD/cytochrome c oxidase assembly protein [Acaricomes phytoseiuli]|uniref:cytochrome c oxidase assembly protein n=1 Tax=Acaricomes phytoseiuli TaxID=291968 RepID=UPI00037B9E5C|nr:cytochrome c oxidase assembly protein [Acaricomes phytoseiuli]MCW1250478.1 bifunctional copper resistance protein CopD/cytochrome c oxidase assembly protein [Acaricomes phytoseiuli]